MLRIFIFLVALLLRRLSRLPGIAVVGASCMQPVQLLWSETCEVPHVPTGFCHGETCSTAAPDHSDSDGTSFRRRRPPTDACTAVANAIWADLGVFDVVILHDGTCRCEIRPGEFTADDAIELLPQNEELIGLQMKGRHLVTALEQGIHQYHANNVTVAYPRYAGIRFHVNSSSSSLQVSATEILTPGCRWVPLEMEKEYTVLVNQALADGRYGYTDLRTRGQFRIGTGLHVADAFWFHATTVCTIRDPHRSPKQRSTSPTSKADTKSKKKRVIRLDSPPSLFELGGPGPWSKNRSVAQVMM